MQLTQGWTRRSMINADCLGWSKSMMRWRVMP